MRQDADSVTDGEDLIRRPVGPRPSVLSRLASLLTDHPVASVVVIALLARLVVAVGSSLLVDGYVIPDEVLYVELGRNVIDKGLTPNEWYPGYGQSFYDSTWTFTAPLLALFELFGTERLVGQIFAAIAGALTAGVTVAIARRFLSPAFAVAAGLVVALTPSIVLFSSVVIREAHIWLALTLVGLGALHLASTQPRRLLLGVVLAAAGLFALAYLRQQTLLAAAWALVLAVIVTPRRWWVPRVAAAVALAAVVPWIVGLGIGGIQLLTTAAPRLDATRATLAQDARTRFGPPATPQGPGGAPTPADRPNSAPGGAASIAARAAANVPAHTDTGLARLPSGLVDVTLRPFPWQSAAGLTLTLAKIETLGWYVLYVLSVLGVVVSIRRSAARLALQFPVLVLGMLVGIAALTQGNLGTAFRHRDQGLWVLALCSAAGVQWLVLESRWAPRRSRTRADEPWPEAPEMPATVGLAPHAHGES